MAETLHGLTEAASFTPGTSAEVVLATTADAWVTERARRCNTTNFATSLLDQAVTINNSAAAANFTVKTQAGSFRLVSNNTCPNIIAGHASNAIASNHSSAILAGGNAGAINEITGASSEYSVIVGGYDNTIAGNQACTISGGAHHSVSASHATIGGGSTHVISEGNGVADYSTITGGYDNQILGGQFNTIIGGTANEITSGLYSSIIGGNGSTIAGSNSTAIGTGCVVGAANKCQLNFTGGTYLSGGIVGINFIPSASLNADSVMDVNGPVAFTFTGSKDAFPTNSASGFILATNDNASPSYPFDINGHLLLQPRTSYAADIVFATGSTTPSVRMVVKGDGKIGIGTATPASSLDNNGSLNDASVSTSGINWQVSDASKYAASIKNAGASGNGLHIEALGYGLIVETGDVGIGTIAPGSLLTLQSTTSAEVLIENTGNAATNLMLDADRAADGNVLGQLQYRWNNTAVSAVMGQAGDDTGNKDNGKLSFWTSATGSLVMHVEIDESGRIICPTMPSSDPGIVGALYHTTGDLKIST